MKLLCVAIVVAGLVAAVASEPASATPTRTLICRGSAANPPGTYSAFATGSIRMNYHKSAGFSKGLAPGACSWSDGGMLPSDPTTLCADNVGSVDEVSFDDKGELYGSLGPNFTKLKDMTWLQRYYTNGAVFALNVVSADVPANCLYVKGLDNVPPQPIPRKATPAPFKQPLPQ